MTDGAPATLRPMAYADLPGVVAIERECYLTPWSPAMFMLELEAVGVRLVALDADERIVGYLICSRYDTVWHVMNVSVDPAARRRGVASALVTELLARIPEAEPQLTLEVRDSNEGAIALYAGFGFVEAGVRRRYYADNGEDARIMWRTPATLRGSLEDVPGAAGAVGERSGARERRTRRSG